MTQRISIKLSVAALTFLLGLLIASICPRSLESFSSAQTNLSDVPSPTLPPLLNPQHINAISVEFRGFTFRDDLVGEFQVINHGPESAIYAGFTETFNCSISFDDGKRINRERLCSCLAGVKGWKILPGQSATLQVYMPKQGRKYKVGFGFFVGKDFRSETVWSKEIILPLLR